MPLKTKDGVILYGLNIKMRPVLLYADSIWKSLGQELVITSTTDGVHSPGSLHPYGFAVDLRSNYFTNEQKAEACNKLRSRLGSSYSVVPEPTHIHVEYRKILYD